MIKTMLIGLLYLITLLVGTIIGFRIHHSTTNKITTKLGVQESKMIELNGVQQYVNIRGKDTSKPLLLWLHGGPGYPLTYLSYIYQKDLEDDFVIVNWEQRGCGRSYSGDDPKKLSIDLLLSDMDDLVDSLCQRFHSKQVYIVGQSWGTVLGMHYCQLHPEKVKAYVGVGQVTDFDQGKLFSAEEALKIATPKDARKLRKFMDDFKAQQDITKVDIENLENMILYSAEYLRGEKELSPFKQIWSGLTSPNFTWKDYKWFSKPSSTQKIFDLQTPLIQYMYYTFDIRQLGTNFQVPIYLIQGENDYITPTQMAKTWYEGIEAPNKHYHEMKECGHTPFLDDPSGFAASLKMMLVSNE